MIETSLISPRKSSFVFGKSLVILGKCPKNVLKSSSFLQNNFRKSSEIFGNLRKVVGNLRKIVKNVVISVYNKQNITWPLVDMNFIFPCSTRHLTSERSGRVRYRVERSKIKFISTRGHVISSIYTITKSMRALWLVNQLWVIVPVNPRKNCASSELLYKSNRPQVFYGL